MLSAKDWADMTHVTTGVDDGSGVCMAGVWDPYNNVFLDGVLAANGLISPYNVAAIGEPGKGFADIMQGGTANLVLDAEGITSDHSTMANSDEVINVVPSSPQWLNRAFQIVQAMPSGNPIASPIIHTNQVKRLRWDPNNAPVKHKVAVAADAALGTPVVGETCTAVISLRFPQDIAYYESQINPSGSVTGITPSASVAYDNPKKVYKVQIEFGSTTIGTEVDALVTAINAHAVGNFVTASDNSTTGFFVESDFYGAVLDVFLLENGTKVATCTDNADMEIGVGSYMEAISREKKAQYAQGHFNRMYLPTGGAISTSTTPGGATATYTANYDRLYIEYENVNGKMPGFNSQGNTSSVTLYVPANGDASDQSEGLAVEATFGLVDAPAGAVEYIW